MVNTWMMKDSLLGETCSEFDVCKEVVTNVLKAATSEEKLEIQKWLKPKAKAIIIMI